MTTKKGGIGGDKAKILSINNYNKEKLNYDFLPGKPKSSCNSQSKGFLIMDNINTDSDSIKTFHQKNYNKINEFKNNIDKKREDNSSRENSLKSNKIIIILIYMIIIN